MKLNKILLTALATIAFFSCKKEPSDFATLSGKIDNKNSDSIALSNPQIGYKKVIKLNDDGSFKDTLKLKQPVFLVLFDGREYTTLYLKNGDNVNVTINAKEFDESVSFSGEGADESNFLAKLTISQEQLMDNNNIFSLPKEEFNTKVDNFIKGLQNDLENKKLDSLFVSMQKQQIDQVKGYLDRAYEEKVYISSVLAKGKPSPKFTDYENFKGGTTSLDDLKGKYVYIDVWATWCNPCKEEIKFLKKVEEEYRGKNIEFVSISVDDKRDYDVWKKMVVDENMKGLQLYAKSDRKFADAYRVSSIPRFILIDPQGNIVEANAPRPSDPKLIELFKSLNL